MKKLIFAAALAISSVASAQGKVVFAGSDTLAGLMTDAIIAAGLDQQIQYIGGGSGNGEKGIQNGDQGIAPMSREIKPEVVQALGAQGVQVIPHVVALDGIAIFVKKTTALPVLDVQTVARIFTCDITKWEQLPGSNQRGTIKVYRRNDASGTTDAFRHFTGVKTFGACVTVLAETTDIAEVTSRDPLALGYAGLSGTTDANRPVALTSKAGAAGVQPTTATIRSFAYPFARRLYVYEVTGARNANPAESALMENVTDRSFMDPIVQAHDFITID